MNLLAVSLLIIIAAFVFSLALVLMLRRLSLKCNFLLYRKIPLIGGIALGLSFIVISWGGTCAYHYSSQESLAIIVASFVMLGLGVTDDILELSVVAKLAVQLIASFFLIFSGIKTQIIYIGPVFNTLITLFWIVAITNAINHLDIMDGLAGCITVIVGLGFLAVALLHKDSAAAVITAALVGAIAGFLVYNLPPAKVYMGNSGSHFLGFTLASIALMLNYAPLEKKVALLSPLLIAGVPIFDTAFLILMRLLKSKLIFKKSNDHLAFRFLKSGYSKKKTLLFMSGFAFFCCVSGVSVILLPSPWAAATVVLVALAGLSVVIKMSKVAVDE